MPTLTLSRSLFRCIVVGLYHNFGLCITYFLLFFFEKNEGVIICRVEWTWQSYVCIQRNDFREERCVISCHKTQINPGFVSLKFSLLFWDSSWSWPSVLSWKNSELTLLVWLFVCLFVFIKHFLIGNEGRGLSKGTKELCTKFLTIPSNMKNLVGDLDSLNVSVATGIVSLYVVWYVVLWYFLVSNGKNHRSWYFTTNNDLPYFAFTFRDFTSFFVDFDRLIRMPGMWTWSFHEAKLPDSTEILPHARIHRGTENRA